MAYPYNSYMQGNRTAYKAVIVNIISTAIYSFLLLIIVLLFISALFLFIPAPTFDLYFFSALAYEASLFISITAFVCSLILWFAFKGKKGRNAAIVLADIVIVLGVLPLFFSVQAAVASDNEIQTGQVLSAELVDNGQRGDYTKAYATVEGKKLLASVWKPKAKTIDKTIIMVHGGGFNNGNRNQLSRLNTEFTKQGYSVVDIDYRLAPDAVIEQQVADVKCAVSWAKKETGTNSAMLYGSSAGGTLALLAAYTTDESFKPSCDGDNTVQKVAAISAATDFEQLVKPQSRLFTPAWVNDFSELEAALGSSIDDSKTLKRLSPKTYVTKDAPNTLLIYSDADRLAPPRQAKVLAKRLTDNKVPNRSVSIGRSHHSFEFMWSGYGMQIARQELQKFYRD